MLVSRSRGIFGSSYVPCQSSSGIDEEIAAETRDRVFAISVATTVEIHHPPRARTAAIYADDMMAVISHCSNAYGRSHCSGELARPIGHQIKSFSEVPIGGEPMGAALGNSPRSGRIWNENHPVDNIKPRYSPFGQKWSPVRFLR